MAQSPSQRSPGQRQPSVGKKLASATTPGKASPSVTATAEPSVKKRQQGSLLDQELLALEKDGAKRHSRGFSEYLLEHSRKVEELQEKNRRLEEELSFDDHATREDPFFNEQVAEKLSDLYVQGNDYMVRLELERKEVARLNALIQESESTLAQQKTKLYELAALDHHHGVLMGRVRKMENDIDRRIVKMNEKLSNNRKLRERIDAQRMERVRMDDIYTKVSLEALSKQHKVARTGEEVQQLRDEVETIEAQIDGIQQEGDEWEQTCDRRAAVVLQELKEIALNQRESEEIVDVDKYKYLGENELMRSLSTTQEDQLQSRAKRGRKATQSRVATDSVLTKYQENRTFIEKIHEVSGTTTVSEMIEAFNNQEAEHFDRIQHVNQLAEEIENHRQIISKLREDIGKLKHRKDSVDFQRMNRIEGLRAKLQFTNEQKKHKEAANQQLQVFLAALKPFIMLFHSRIGCSDLHADSDLKKILGQVEEQIVTILQKYHAKILSDQTTKLASDPIELSRGSAGKRESSAAKFRRGMVAIDGSPDSPEGRPRSTTSAGATSLLHASPTATHGITSPDGHKAPNLKAITALVAKQQPYRYTGLRPPHMSVEELRRKDNVEEEYPLTYKELKSKVWNSNILG